jgi:hypothetical protein
LFNWEIPLNYMMFAAIASVLTGAFPTWKKGWIIRSLAMFLGLLIAALLPWWLRDESGHLIISGHQSLTTIVLISLVRLALTDGYRIVWTTRRQVLLRVSITFALSLLGIWIIFSTGVLSSTANTTPWHHWGAYIGPAELVIAGAVPLHDIPLQYGLGPTLLLAQTCYSNCWNGLYWIAGISTAVMAALLAWMSLRLWPDRHPMSNMIILAIILATTLIWTAYPPELVAALATPSTTGIRFLPGILMLAWVFYINQHRSFSRTAEAGGHIIWVSCIAWSPESAIHATAVWVPYYIWMHVLFDVPSSSNARVLILKSVLKIATVFVVGLGACGLIFRWALGDWPLPAEYGTYMLFPPGPLPINTKGTVWFALASLGCWLYAWLLSKPQKLYPNTARILWLVALYSTATFTYYLGRSHDNNILNLLPYITLLLFASYRLAAGSMSASTLIATLLAAILGWIPNFGFVHYKEAQVQSQLLSFSPSDLTASFDRESGIGQFYMAPQAKVSRLRPEDAEAALDHIRSKFQEPVEIFDLFMLVDGGEPATPWNALHGPANYVFIPSNRRATYLERVSKRIKRSGWVLYDKSMDMTSYLIEYDGAYDRAQELEFGTYRGIRFTPKSTDQRQSP